MARFAEHHWFVLGDGSTKDRWEVWQHRDVGGISWGHLHKNLLAPEAGVGNGPGRCLMRWDGDRAALLQETIRTSPDVYSWTQRYLVWPGPNSNTYVQWVLGDGYRLGWRAFGKRFPCIKQCNTRHEDISR
jgi:hypothetical protein